MVKSNNQLISFVVPVYNESAGLAVFHKSLLDVIKKSLKNNYEIIYCEDGSTDNTAELINKWHAGNKRVKLIKLSRNFGKEIATTAGLNAAAGQAIITLDGDGQHPVSLIPKFLDHWQKGSKVVIGIRTENKNEGLVKHWGSKFFYSFFNRFTRMNLIPGSTDYRLIDRSVQQEFKKLTERNRITRGLIDWLGYERDYIYFKAKPRQSGQAAYSFRKLLKLAIDSVVSMSLSPLYITAYIGALVLPLAVLTGLVMLVNVLLGDPLGIHATASAYLVVLLVSLMGIVMLSQGIIGLYLSHIHTETQNRPLYIVDKDNSLLNGK
jgi:glycosyltransferase involved in cell wall biosynthesis